MKAVQFHKMTAQTPLVAIQASASIQLAFETAVPHFRFISVPAGIPENIPHEANIFIAAPFIKAGEQLPKNSPQGWPWGVEWVHLMSVGIDLYPRWIFDGTKVTSARGTSAAALAEFALAAMFASAKNMPDIWVRSMKDWVAEPIGMLEGATLGIVGFGSIGEALSIRACALGMKVLACRRSDAKLTVLGVELVATLEEVFARSDYVVLAAPATTQTESMINKSVISKSKRGLHLINISRGSLIDDCALLSALNDGQIALASLDVTNPEPLPAGHVFYEHKKVHLSPHTSVHTTTTLDNLVAHFVRNLERFDTGKELTDLVNPSRGY